jgi:hypothetical protein
MKYHVVLLSLIMAASTAPSTTSTLTERDDVVSAMAAVPNWTIEGFKRNCSAADTSCIVVFLVNPNDGSPRAAACGYEAFWQTR